MPADQVDVLIAGAGPTGLALACDLARRGVEVRIVEKGTGLFPGSRGKALSPRLLEVFDDLGVVSDVLAGATTHMRVVNYERGQVLSTAVTDAGTAATPAVPYPSVAWLPQWRTQEILHARLAGLGVGVDFGYELRDVSQDAASVTCVLGRADGGQERVGSRYLVGCDGAHSAVRKGLGLAFEGVARQDLRHAFVGDLRVAGLSTDCSHLWNDPGLGFLLLTPFKGTPVWQFQALLPIDAHPHAPDASVISFQRIVDEISGGLPIRLSDLTWASQFSVSERIVEHYRDGRVFLAGDAAHVYSPAGGQGMTTGIQDAYNLGWKLGAALREAPDSLLDTYEAERRPVAQRALTGSGRRFDEILASTEDPHIDSAQIWKTVLNPETSQLGISYRGGPLAPEAAPVSATLRPGDRAPDSLCFDPGRDADVRLFDLFRGPHWTVLVFADAEQSVDTATRQLAGIDVHTWALGGRSAGTLVDSGAIARSSYGVGSPTAVLIRPDGYVGAIASAARSAVGTSISPGVVLDVFRRLLVPAAVDASGP